MHNRQSRKWLASLIFMSRQFIRHMVQATRSQCWNMTKGLPKWPATQGQIKLHQKHGTPTEFAEACVDAIGEISVQEAQKAIDKYLAEWKAA